MASAGTGAGVGLPHASQPDTSSSDTHPSRQSPPDTEHSSWASLRLTNQGTRFNSSDQSPRTMNPCLGRQYQHPEVPTISKQTTTTRPKSRILFQRTVGAPL